MSYPKKLPESGWDFKWFKVQSPVKNWFSLWFWSFLALADEILSAVPEKNYWWSSSTAALPFHSPGHFVSFSDRGRTHSRRARHLSTKRWNSPTYRLQPPCGLRSRIFAKKCVSQWKVSVKVLRITYFSYYPTQNHCFGPSGFRSR